MTTNPATLARIYDPETSKTAARKTVSRTYLVRLQVLACLQEHGPLTHDQLITVYGQTPDAPLASASSIRTRCAELVRAGLVEPAGRDRSRMGNPAQLWRALNVQEMETPAHEC